MNVERIPTCDTTFQSLYGHNQPHRRMVGDKWLKKTHTGRKQAMIDIVSSRRHVSIWHFRELDMMRNEHRTQVTGVKWGFLSHQFKGAILCSSGMQRAMLTMTKLLVIGGPVGPGWLRATTSNLLTRRDWANLVNKLSWFRWCWRIFQPCFQA